VVRDTEVDAIQGPDAPREAQAGSRDGRESNAERSLAVEAAQG